MRRTTIALAIATMSMALFVAWSTAPACAQPRRGLQNPKPNYPPQPGITRNGVTMRSSPHNRTTNYVVPGGGYYYYGWSPGYYYTNRYYYGGYQVCPYCGLRGCYGACRGPIYYPPVVADAGSLYGPRAVRQFLGVDGNNNNNNNAGGGNAPMRAAPAQAPDTPPQLSNPTTRARAWRFVEYGDRQFKQGNYHQAAERYEKAQSQAPEIPEVYFRIGFANMGAEKYAEAVVAIREGLRREPNWPDSGFVLEELYPGPNAKRAVFRQLHTHLADHPNDADAVFLLAVLQHFDGQDEAAELGFRRVVDLLGVAPHAVVFLTPAPAAQVAPPAEQKEAEQPEQDEGGPLLR